MKWWKRLDIARVAVVKAGKRGGELAHRVAVQGMDRAKLTGAKLARHIIGVQIAAGATPKMMRESARSVMNRPMARGSDRAWQAAYVMEASKHVPGLLPGREPAPARSTGPTRPVVRRGPEVTAGPAWDGMTWSRPSARTDLEAGQ